MVSYLLEGFVAAMDYSAMSSLSVDPSVTVCNPKLLSERQLSDVPDILLFCYSQTLRRVTLHTSQDRNFRYHSFASK